jgi:hypothetical protein
LEGHTPLTFACGHTVARAELNNVRWTSHCRTWFSSQWRPVPVDPAMKKLEQENRRLTTRLKKAEALLDFPKKLSSLLQIPLIPFESDEAD